MTAYGYCVTEKEMEEELVRAMESIGETPQYAIYVGEMLLLNDGTFLFPEDIAASDVRLYSRENAQSVVDALIAAGVDARMSLVNGDAILAGK